MDHFIQILIHYVASFIELCGIFLIIATVIKEMYLIIVEYRFHIKNTDRDTTMNQGLATSLEILLGAEILKTIAYRDIRQLVEVGVLMLIRVFMTVLIHWELSHKLKEERREKELKEEEDTSKI
ncbi:MAG: DUF1622 domain-containing protein [Tissierellia bacterium]|nr:DUF1622 domain-containing protein [Tissierellia bacterium]